MITGLSHITFIVKDLEKAALFFTTVFDAEEVYASGGETFSLAEERFFLVNGLWLCVMQGEAPVERSYHHVAFQVREEDIEHYIARIKAVGAEIKPGRARVDGEGRSIYFYDFDNHLFELHAGTLPERLARYALEM